MTETTAGAPTDQVWRVGAELRVLRPEAVRLLDTANEIAWQVVDASLLELVRLRIASLLGNEAGLARRSSTARGLGLTEATVSEIPEYAGSSVFSPRERDCLAFTEQCVIDVSGVSDEDRARLGAHFSATGMRDFVTALYVTECTQRLELMGPILLRAHDVDSAPPALDPPGGEAIRDVDSLRDALRRYQDAVVRGRAVDAVTTELVRLRCARTHDCRICRTLRLADAREAGADDEMTQKIDFYERSDLPERAKLALRITDAFITLPGSLSESTVAAARAEFTPDELAELCLDITKWSTQKIHVALGTDGAEGLPVNDDGVSFFGFGEDGRVAGYAETLGALPDLR